MSETDRLATAATVVIDFDRFSVRPGRRDCNKGESETGPGRVALAGGRLKQSGLRLSYRIGPEVGNFVRPCISQPCSVPLVLLRQRMSV